MGQDQCCDNGARKSFYPVDETSIILQNEHIKNLASQHKESLLKPTSTISSTSNKTAKLDIQIPKKKSKKLKEQKTPSADLQVTPNAELSLSEEQYQRLLADLKKDIGEQNHKEKANKKQKKKKKKETEENNKKQNRQPGDFTEIEIDLESSQQRIRRSNIFADP